MGLTVSGLASGLDTDAIIQQLLSVQRRRISLLEQRKADEQRRVDALSTLKTKLSTLASKAANLNKAATLLAKHATTDTPGTQAAILEASADSDAVLGSFQVTVNRLATSTSVSSTASVGQPVDTGVALTDAGLATTPTAGTFSINGVSISVDPTTDTLNDVITRINSSGAGVTATLSGNQLSISANNGSTPVQLGAGGDTSNFLQAARLLASPEGTTRTSTGVLGVVQVTETLDNARLAKAIGSGAGSFKINGVTIEFDTAQHSLSDIIAKINNSSAGVRASYDSATDTVALVQEETGSTSISLEYVSGPDLLDGLNLASAPQSLGQNAEFTIDTGSGPQTYYSTSNTATNAVAGVTLKLLRESPDPVTVTVSQDTDAAISAVKEFVDAYNAVVEHIRSVTRVDPTGDNDGALAADGGLHRIEAALRNIVTGGADGDPGVYSAFAQIGLTFGAVGSSVGTTETLIMDEEQFAVALSADADSVSKLFGADSDTATGITQKLAAFLDPYTQFNGILDQRQDAGNDRIEDIDDRIARVEDRLAAEEERLRRQFTQMEQALARLQSMQSSLAMGLARLQG